MARNYFEPRHWHGLHQGLHTPIAGIGDYHVPGQSTRHLQPVAEIPSDFDLLEMHPVVLTHHRDLRASP
jgi:hypothetical protein